jgi:hypothetical protein
MIEEFYYKLTSQGYKEKVKGFSEFQTFNNDKFNLLFQFLKDNCDNDNVLTDEEINLLSKIENLDMCDYNIDILDLESELKEIEINKLQSELEHLEKEIKIEETLNVIII